MQKEVIEAFKIRMEDGQERECRHIERLEFCNGDKEGKLRITVSTEYDFDNADFVVLKLPNNCYQCPVGVCCVEGKSCGRNVPWTEIDSKQRPSTCKLRTLEQFLGLIIRK